MDPLDKRYHDQLEPQEQSLGDGGDLHAGQQSETQPWHQSGLAADIDRRLAQVQQQERWLQQQQHPDLLTPPAGGQDSLTGQQDASRHQQLVVVDTSRNDWQQRVAQLAPEADLLLLSGEEHGLERISQAVARQPYRTITLLPGSDGNGRRFLGADALQESSSLPQKAALQVLAGDLPHSLQEALAREHSLSVLEVPAAEPILTRIENDASALLSLGRDLLREAQGKGRLQQTIEASFAAANQAAVLGAALALINGESRLPQIQWAHFGKGSVRGAFLQERNTVLISDQLRGGGAELEAVLLHEIGHWLEANTGTDSPGDEGESFSARIRGATPDQELIRDSAQLSIDGVLVQAELMDAMPTSGDITPPALISDQQSRATLNSAGSQITLNFSETLQSASISPSQFSFSDLIGGQVFSGITVSSITVNGSAVVLNLNTPLSSTQAQNLKLRYQPSALFSERLEDTAGNGVADFEVVIDFSSTSSLVNQAPATVLDSASLLEDGVFTRNASQGVLSNDSDPNNGDQLRVMGIKLAANAANTVAVSTGSPGLITNPYGTLSINADGSYRFSANGPSSQSLRAGAMATTSFTVVVSDGALASESTLSFAITGTNDAPTVSGLAELGSIQEDGTFIITSQQLLAIASDIDAGDTLSVANLTLRSGQGTLTANINGTWTFSPAQNWNGEVRFSYQISDGTVTIGSPRNDLAILGNSLYLLTDNGSWTQTEARAQQLGGHLATINDALENQFIWNQFTNQAPAAWIGYNKESGTYEWSSGERSPYTNWHPGSPDFSWEHYAHIALYQDILGPGLWGDSDNIGTGNLGLGKGLAEIPFIRRGDSAYAIVQGPTWEAAQANAIALGGNLISINSEEENSWIAANIKQLGDPGDWKFWIGLTNDGSASSWESQDWEWVNGESISFQAWHKDEPWISDNSRYAFINLPTSSVNPANNEGVWIPYSNYFNYDWRDGVYGVREPKGIVEIKLPITTRLFVTPVNDAPLASGSAALSAVLEDANAPSGSSVASLFSSNFNDGTDTIPGGSAANTLLGVVITANAATSAQGKWQWLNISSWTDIPTTGLSNATGLFLSASTNLRFLPAANFNSTPGALTTRLVDSSATGLSNGNTLNVSTSGGTSPYSAATVALATSITPVNDAPTLTSIATISGASEDSFKEITYADLAAAANEADIDGDPLSFRIDSLSTGTLEKWSGSTWLAVTPGSTLLSVGEKLQWKAAPNANGTLNAFSVSAYDGALASSSPVQVQVSVTPVNDAPLASGSAALSAVLEDANAPSGSSVASLFSSNFNDATDTIPGGSAPNTLLGVVITANAATSAQGKWQWLNNSSWTDIPTTGLSNTTGLFLTAATSIRFLPAPNFNGSPGALTSRLVDSSATGLSNGNTLNVSTSGGTSPYSTATVALGTSVIALNDAPVAFGAVSLAAVLEDATAPNGDTVANLFSGHFSDTADAVGGGSSANGLAGIVVSGNAATAAQGKWQWQAAGASSWTDIASTGLSDATGLFLASTTSLRFLPAAHFNGTPGALSTRLVDSSATGLSNGGSINVSTNGGTTSYSGTTVFLSTSIGAINDAPLRTSAAPTPISVLEDSTNTVASPLGLSSLTYGGGGPDETSQIFTATITGIPAFINIFKADGVTQVSVNDTLAVNELQGLKFKTIANANGAGNLTWTIRDSGGTTNNGSDSSSDSLAITVATVNDAPYLSGQSPTLPSGYESTPYLIRAQDLLIGFSDSDITDQLSITNLTATNGTLADNDNGTWSFTPVVSNAINLGQIPEDTPKTLNVDDLLGGSRTAIQVQLYYDVVDSTGAAVSSSSGFELARTSSVSAVTVSNLNVTSGSGSLTANANNTWTFTPTPNWFGPVLFSYGISTGGATLAYTGSLNVQPLNDAPLLNPDSRFLAEDNRTQGFSSLLGNDSDVEASQLSLVMVRDAIDPSNVASVNQAANSPATLLSNGYGTLEVQANGQYSFTANGSLSQALALGQQAQTAFVYQASDGALVSSSTVTFTIIGANDLPTVEADTRAIAEDAVLVVPASQGVLANDVDRDSGTQLRVHKLSTAGQPAVELGLSGYALLNNEYGTLLMRADGSYSFVADGHASQTLAAGQTANTSFSYQVDDGQSDLGIGGINTSSLSFTITGTNDAPLINGQLNLGMIAEDGSITITAAQLLAVASDIDTPSQNLSVLSVSVDPSQGQITAAGSAWIFAPAVDWNGSADIRFVVSDGSSQSLPKSLSNGVTIRGDRLYLLTTGNSWQGSQLQAQQLGGQLSAIASSAEQSFLEQWLPDNTAAWIGLNDSTTEGLWQWSDGSPITFLRWANAEPNDDSWMANGLGADFAQLLPYSGAGTDPYPRRNWADFSGNLNATVGITEAPFLRRGSSAYVLVDAPSWDQGEANAIRLGGHLATINDAAENAWLLSSFGNNSFNAYIGLNDLAVEGVWQWSSGKSSSYRNWAPNEPNNAGDTTSSDYVLMHLWSYSRSGTWNDGENYGVGKGIAEIDLAGVASLTVTSVADAPLPIADTGYNVEDQLLSVNASAGLLANDRDPDGSTLQVVGVAEGSAASSFTPLSNGSVSLSNGYGTLTVLADGSYTFQAHGALSQEIPVGSSATVSFSYQVSDGSLQSSSTLTIAISGDNDAPQVLGDQRSIGEDQTINIPASGGVLANDSDVDQNAQLTVVGIKANGSSGQPLALLNGQRVISTSYGDLTMRADGSYSFVATGSTSQPLAPGQTVQLVFDVSVSDAIATAQTSSLTLTLIGTNDAPVLAVPITLPDGVDGQPYTFTTGQLLQGWSDVDTGDGLEVVESTLFSNAGNLENLGNGSWRFIRSAENRIDLGTLPEDGSRNLNLAQLLGGSLGAIGITLNYDVRDRFGGQVPAVPPATFNLQRGSAISNASVTNLRVQPADAGVLTGNQNSGWAFTPRQEFNGAVQLLYTVVTANGSSDYVADLRVTSVNDAPVMVTPSTLSTTEDRSLLLAGFSVADVDADELTLTLEVGMGYLTLANGTGLAASSGDGSPTSPMQLRGPVTALNAALAGITYQPTTNAIGSDTLLITTIDASTTGSGGAALISRSIPISITAVNDPPERLTGTLANLIINEDAAATSLGLEQLSYGPGGGSDEAAQQLTFTVNSVPNPLRIGAVLRSDSSPVQIGDVLTIAELQGLRFQPNPNASGLGSFSFSVSDGVGGSLSETIVIQVREQNDAPVRLGEIPEQLVVSEASGLTSLGLANLRYAAAEALSLPTSALVAMDQGNGTQLIGLLEPGSGHFTAIGEAAYQSMLGDEVVAERTTGAELLVRQANTILRINLSTGEQRTLLNRAPMLLCYQPGATTEADSLLVYVNSTGTIQAINLTTGSATTLANGVLPNASIQAGGFAALNTQTNRVSLLSRDSTGVLLTNVDLQNGTQTTSRPNLPYLQAISTGGSDKGLYGLWEDNDQQGVLVIGRVNPADGTHQSLARLSTGNPSGGFTNGNFTVNAEGIAFVHYSGLFGGQVGSWIAAVDTNTGSVLGASENPGDLIRGTAWLAHETNQQLSVRITALPNANLGAVVLADGSTAVVQGNVYSLAELQSMQFRSSREGQGTGSFSFVVEDNGTTSGVAASLGISETISIRVLPVNDAPSSSGRTLDPFLILDSNNLSLNATSGLYEPVALNIGALLNGATVSYTPGGGVDEAQQPLTYRITELPRATNTLVQPYITSTTELVSYARLTTSFAAGDQLQAVVNGATVTYTVTSADINATDEASTQTTIARNLVATINANNAVNSVVRADVSAGDSRRISLTASNAGVTLGLTSTTSLGDVLLNNAVQTVGAVLLRAQLDQLQFRASLDVADFSASGRLGQFSFVVGDTAAAGSGPDAVLKQSLTILVDTDQAGASNTTRISSNSNRQAIAAAQRAASSLDPLNPNLRFTAASLTYNGQPVQVYATSSINSELSSANPLYLADMGGSGRLDSEAINFSASTTPFIFDIPVTSNQRGEKIVHSFQYEASLSGQLRSNVSNPNYTSNSVAGFSLETDGSWSFDPMHAAYSSMPVGEFRQVNITYTESTSGITRGLTLELSKVEALTGETLIIVTPIGPGEMFTTYSRDQWIASNPEGRDQDRYFKYISEYTLETYGAIDTGELTDGGDKIYAWTGDIKTFDGEPLTLLDGTIITSAGYYDFTRRNGIGDGVEFLYQTAIEKGVPVDYITGMRFYLTNNMYGDNDPADGNVRDPGAPINIMTELGTITTYSAYASYENVNNGDSTDSSLTIIIPTLSTPNGQGNFDGGSGLALGNAAGPEISAMALNNATAVLVGSAAGTGTAQGQIALSLQGGDEGKQADTGDQDSQGASKLAQGAGANAKPKPGDPGDQRGPAERGLKLDPIQQLASTATAEPSGLLEQLSDTNVLGTNLLDALALGAGVLYLLYGPKAIEASKGGFSSWLAGGFGRRSAAAATAGGERSVLALFLMRQPSGQQQLVAARVGQGSLKLLAQQELAPQQAGAQLSEALAAVLEQLPRERCELLLLDPRLQRAAVAATAQLDQLGERRQELASDALASPLAACSDNELVQLRAWLNKPSGTLPQDLPLFQLLQQRQQSYAANLPEQQATMASLIELSLALAWSERP